MFCKKCGQKIDDGSMFCEYCGARVTNPQIVYKTNILKSSKSSSKRFIVIASVVIAILVICSVIFVTQKKRSDIKSNLFCGSFDESRVVFPNDGEAYIDGELLIKKKDSVSEKDFAKVIKNYGGTIVGFNNITAIYQVDFAEAYGDKLFSLMSAFLKEPTIESVTLNYVYYTDCLVGDAPQLDDTLMGIDKAYDDTLVGDIKVALIGTSPKSSGISELIPEANISGSEIGTAGMVSLFEWEYKVSREIFDGAKILEISVDLLPTCEEENEENRLNEEIGLFFQSINEKEVDCLFINPIKNNDSYFLVNMESDIARQMTVNVGSVGDGIVSDNVDIYVEGDISESLEYTVSIALLSWAEDNELPGSVIKFILDYSTITDSEKSIQILNADIAVEAAKKLRAYIASETDAVNVEEIKFENFELNYLHNLIELIKREKGYVQNEMGVSKVMGVGPYDAMVKLLDNAFWCVENDDYESFCSICQGDTESAFDYFCNRKSQKGRDIDYVDYDNIKYKILADDGEIYWCFALLYQFNNSDYDYLTKLFCISEVDNEWKFDYMGEVDIYKGKYATLFESIYDNYPDEYVSAMNNNRNRVPEDIDSNLFWVDNDLYIPGAFFSDVGLIWQNADGSVDVVVSIMNGMDAPKSISNVQLVVKDEKLGEIINQSFDVGEVGGKQSQSFTFHVSPEDVKSGTKTWTSVGSSVTFN